MILRCAVFAGYGNMTPKTQEGQLFLIFYAILGIPLMMSFLANVGVKINEGNKKLADSINCFTNPKLDQFVDTVVIIVLGVTLFILVPAGIFFYVEDWGYITACYFAVVTLSTVGFGDYTPGNIHYTVKPVCNDHLYNKIYYLWFIQ